MLARRLSTAAAAGKTPPINRTQESMRVFKQAMRATRLELIAHGKHRPPVRVAEAKQPATRALDKNAFSAAMRSMRRDAAERPLREHAASQARITRRGVANLIGVSRKT